jgi:hypothetical protein
VVSDFDCFLLGTRGIRYETPLPKEQVGMVLEMIEDTEKIEGLDRQLVREHEKQNNSSYDAEVWIW